MYQLTNGDYIIRISDGACIPMDEGNGDYQEYLKWVRKGNVALEAVPIVPVIPQPTIEERTKNLETDMVTVKKLLKI